MPAKKSKKKAVQKSTKPRKVSAYTIVRVLKTTSDRANTISAMMGLTVADYLDTVVPHVPESVVKPTPTPATATVVPEQLHASITTGEPSEPTAPHI